MAAARKTRRTQEPAASAELAAGAPPGEIEALQKRIRESEGEGLARYRDPLGGRWLVLAALPLSRVAPTPFQRDLSEAHAERLQDVIERVGSFLDPVIAVPSDAGGGEAAFWSPNGLHRLNALGRLGTRSVVARIRPYRPRGKPAPEAEALRDHMEQAAAKFDADRIRAEQVARTTGGGE